MEHTMVEGTTEVATSQPMEVEGAKKVEKVEGGGAAKNGITVAPVRGTIKAHFSKLIIQGQKASKLVQREEKNDGGSKSANSNLKTTMKPQKTRKKLGPKLMRGAKSTIKKGKLPRETEPDSSQMRISSYFYKKLGIIGNGLAKNLGNIPMGNAENPTKTRNLV